MMRKAIWMVAVMALAALVAAPDAEAQDGDGKLRIIAFGPHPDDAELRAAGVAALWAAQGHHVKFVSVTNGDIGHHEMAGGPLARRRTAEVKNAAHILGIEASEVLDIHDGELLPTLEYRRMIVRLIKSWRADIVITPRPNDYHPDHRYTGVLVNDAAYMVTVPFFVPDVPALKRNPVFLYYADDFQKPNPFAPDMVVPIDSVIEKKLDALVSLTSQFVEGGANGNDGLIPKTPEQKRQRETTVRNGFRTRNVAVADKYRAKMVELLGDKAKAAKYAEAFEVCEYGRRPTPQELRKMFPVPQSLAQN